MLATLPLDKMTMSEKISIMEVLWENITQDSQNYPSPPWHEEILKHRENMLKSGEAVFEDWELVKKELWDELIDNSGTG
jgi:hypothetical protein